MDIKTTACRYSKSKVRFRLAPEDVSARLTGYEHNAVSPVALADPNVPLVLSHHIAALQPDFFWLGGGEVDLKLGFSCRQFVQVLHSSHAIYIDTMCIRDIKTGTLALCASHSQSKRSYAYANSGVARNGVHVQRAHSRILSRFQRNLTSGFTKDE